MKKWSKCSAFLLLFLMLGTTAAKAADGRKEFRVALVPERNIFEQQRRYRSLCDYICTMIPVEFTFEVQKGYKDVLFALKEGKVEGAFMGSFVATYGIDNFGFIPLVRPVWPTGKSHYGTYIFKTSGIPVSRDLTTWKGRSFIFVGPNTSAGYYYPLALLRKGGVRVPGEFFSNIQFVESHDTAVWMVANGLADIGAAKDTVYNDFTKRKPAVGENVEILYTGGRFPDLTLVTKADLPQEIRESIRSVFLAMNSNQEGKEVLKMFGALEFINTTQDEYDEVRQTVKDSGYDIKAIRNLEN